MNKTVNSKSRFTQDLVLKRTVKINRILIKLLIN